MNVKYYFEDGDTEYALDCEIDYTPYSRGSFRDGLQQEPDEPESVDVYSAKLNGVDILVLLSQEVIDKIEQKAADEIADKNQDYEP